MMYFKCSGLMHAVRSWRLTRPLGISLIFHLGMLGAGVGFSVSGAGLPEAAVKGSTHATLRIEKQPPVALSVEPRALPPASLVKSSASIQERAARALRPKSLPNPDRRESHDVLRSTKATEFAVNAGSHTPNEAPTPRLTDAAPRAAANEAANTMPTMPDSPRASGLGSENTAGASAEAMRQYRTDLAVAARRFKRYSQSARAQGFEGTVDVAVRLDAHVPLPDVRLEVSSGRVLLDEEALLMIQKAVRQTTIPESLKNKGVKVVLSVVFSLKEAEN